MKIIDKNKDYYDFYQNIYRDDTFTFDRRDSYPLTKEEFCSYFDYKYITRWTDDKKHYIENLVMLQICHTFWLFKLDAEISNYKCTDYILSLEESWKDYNSDIEQLKLSKVTRGCSYYYYNRNSYKPYEDSKIFNEFKVYNGNKLIIKTIPILKNIGIPQLIPPLDIYLTLEEYFSEMKTSSERTDPIGMTNDDKIISRGFDIKTSFRGKR